MGDRWKITGNDIYTYSGYLQTINEGLGSWDNMVEGLNFAAGKNHGKGGPMAATLDQVEVKDQLYTGAFDHLKVNRQEHGWLDWDGPLGRGLVPDFVNIGVGFSGIFGLGAGSSIELNWVAHGPQKSLWPITTVTQGLGVGYSIDATINIGSSRYSGRAAEISRTMLQTNTAVNRRIRLWHAIKYWNWIAHGTGPHKWSCRN